MATPTKTPVEELATELILAELSEQSVSRAKIIDVMTGIRAELTQDLVQLLARGNSGQLEIYQIPEATRLAQFTAATLAREVTSVAAPLVLDCYDQGYGLSPKMLGRRAPDSLPDSSAAAALTRGLGTQAGTYTANALSHWLTVSASTGTRTSVVLGGVDDLFLGPIFSRLWQGAGEALADAFAIGNLAWQGGEGARIPGLKKFWLSVLDGQARDWHYRAYLNYHPGGKRGPIPIDEYFLVHGEHGLGPRDPALSPESRFGCRCASIVYESGMELGR